MGRDNETVSDRRLVEAALRDPNAYAALIARYEAILGRYVRRLLGPHLQAADDVLQEIFIKAYVNLNDFDRVRPFAPWIYRIAHNEAMSFLRKSRAGPPLVSAEDAKLILDNLADPDDPAQALWRSEAMATLNRDLAGLDRRYREVLVLRYLEEKSYDEIADILALPPGTVATYISRGLKQLRQPNTVSGVGP